VFVQWITLNQFDAASLQAVLRSFRHVFPDAEIYVDALHVALVGRAQPAPDRQCLHPQRGTHQQGAVLAWGNFLTLLINFVIIAFVLFLVIRLMNQLVRAEAAKPAAPTKQEELLTEIRDLLKASPK